MSQHKETSWEEFLHQYQPPADYEETRSQLKEFCERHQRLENKICLITSGGTTVPLEHNTVRFVDNFSAGTRGAASAEYFFKLGYAVIFLYRSKSLEPFTRHFTMQRVFDMLQVQDRGPSTTITVKEEFTETLASQLRQYKSAQESRSILLVPFTTVSDYFWLIRAACEYLSPSGPKALVYLAAAVSDFYVPKEQVSTHKIQSNTGPLAIQLQLVPKMLAPLVSSWVPAAYVVSFKLETEEALLIPKASGALHNYRHKLVIANLLQTRRYRVVMVTPSSHWDITISPEQIKAGDELERPLVDEVVRLHDEFNGNKSETKEK